MSHSGSVYSYMGGVMYHSPNPFDVFNRTYANNQGKRSEGGRVSNKYSTSLVWSIEIVAWVKPYQAQ